MTDEIFKNVKVDYDLLLDYGFCKHDDHFEYKTLIVDATFNLSITIENEDKVSIKLVDVLSDEEYLIYLIKSASGEFVGRVRSEIESVLNDIKDKCFTPCIYKSVQSKKIIAYIKEKYGDELEFLWENDDSGIWRRKDNKKWYGVLMKVTGDKFGLEKDTIFEVLNLKMNSETLLNIIDNKTFFKGFHMNKKHWCSILLNLDSIETISKLIDDSYTLVGSGKNKK